MEFILLGASDHCPALVQIQQESYSPLKPFKVFNFWTKHLEFLRTIVEFWKGLMEGSHMVNLYKKLKRLKASLKAFNKIHYVDIYKNVARKKEEL